MVTPPDLDALRDALLALTPAQQVAVETLAGGGTQQSAAEVAGVTRETVTRWAGHVPSFKATLNLYREAIVSEHLDMARRIRGKALAAVELALDSGTVDPLAVLRVVDAPPAVGPTVPEAILDAEISRTRVELSPLPLPGGLDAQLDLLHNPPPSHEERADELTITRLASAARLSPITFSD